jgi:outer membrane cobalamin receptor
MTTPARRPLRSLRTAGLAATIALVGFPLAPADGLARPAPSELEEPALGELELEQLLAVRIVSASKTDEPLSTAPATVIVIDRSEILARGYRELSEILDDLPSMEVARPYGATYFKNYWRGFRNNIGDPWLLLVDGLVLNHLYFDTADVMATLPLSDIERVEVVYGPASAVYGPNAFSGVINVVTRRFAAASGNHQVVSLGTGSNLERIADVFAAHEGEKLRLRATARIDTGDVEREAGDRYEYTSEKYLSDWRLWGGLLDNPSLGGKYESPHRNVGIDLRAEIDGLEAGLQYFLLRSGYGSEYSVDRSQTNGVWSRPDLAAHLRLSRRLSPSTTSTTLFRYRESDVSGDSMFLESIPGVDSEGNPTQLVRVSYWQALNSSWSLFQDFEAKLSERLSITAGFKWEQKDLQKAYDISSGPAIPADEVDASTYPFPPSPSEATRAQNRITTEDRGLYVEGRYLLGAAGQVNLGARVDENSVYGRATTVRAGWVVSRGPWTAKALYGEAFQAPNPRLLYGGWTVSGSDVDLDPERSRTFELSIGRTSGPTHALFSLYRVRDYDTIVNSSVGARNVAERTISGFDLHLLGQVALPSGGDLRLWAYWSRILEAEQSPIDPASGTAEGRIGDLAPNKIIAGATARLGRHLTATLRGRWIDERRTVATNPVGRVPSYATIDATLVWRDLFAEGLSLVLSAENLLDEEYFHPGIREASAGVEPGTFDSTGAWQGSRGYYSSLLPQPGRTVSLRLRIETD